jgi:hypothetical protein
MKWYLCVRKHKRGPKGPFFDSERRRIHAKWQSHGMPLTGYARIGASEVVVRIRVPAPIQKGGHKDPLFELERHRIHAEWRSHGMPLTGYVQIGGSEKS